MNTMRNIFLLFPIILSSQFAYNSHRALNQQEPQRASLGQANNNNDIFSNMQPIVDPLDNALQKGILRNCHHKIETIIKIWGTKEERSISEEQRNTYLSTIPNGCIFYGPHGSGKLMAVQAIAQECNLPLFMYEAHLMPPSDRIQLLQQIFEKAAACKAPCLLNIRSLNAFTNDNGDQTPEMECLCWLLDAYKNHPILFIGTIQPKSYISHELGGALGHNLIKFPPLSTNQRKELIAFHMRKFYKGDDNEELAQELAEKTDGFVYHSLQGLVRQAKMNLSVRTKFHSVRLQREDFLEVLNEIEARKKTKKTAWETFLAKAKKWALPAAIVCAVSCGFFFGYKYLKRNPLLGKV